jgi:hypothetical protein
MCVMVSQLHLTAQISFFVHHHVIIYDNLYLFYKKRNVGYFNTRTSSAHEGTNFGIKKHTASVRPCQKTYVATRNLSLQSTMKASQMEAESTYTASSYSLRSSSPTSRHLTTLAESMLSQNFSRIKKYGIRIDGSIDVCKRMKAMDRFDTEDCVKMPRFILCSLKACGTGINLIRANHVFLMDPWFLHIQDAKQALKNGIFKTFKMRTVGKQRLLQWMTYWKRRTSTVMTKNEYNCCLRIIMYLPLPYCDTRFLDSSSTPS